ncbi:NIF family HAD-type phosphatase [Comamonas thiooxydans]|uniref:NIF family HAD-type phosphatase n=1 Tax=Comamonas thiooxydans TaxID=363952 RepID=UPI0013F40CE0|nr:NIF family HAD-type phosphatase [Comamonas thiooxydans]
MFDLDNTLVKTDDLKEVREASKNNYDPGHLAHLNALIRLNPLRRIYEQHFLKKLRAYFPQLKLGVFTRAPRSYAEAVLAWAYPDFDWDVIVAYEDVSPTKPYGSGVHKAMETVGAENLNHVALIGDNDIDVKAAYNAGCLVAVDKRSWPSHMLPEHWRAHDLIPDGIIESAQDVLDFIQDHLPFLPNLERLHEGGKLQRGMRYDKVGYWAVGDTRRYSISVAGRSVSNHKSVQLLRQAHALSDSIEDNKDSAAFPQPWLEAIRNFINVTFYTIFKQKDVVVTVVPHRPSRHPRLEQLLNQLDTYLAVHPIGKLTVTCVPNLLAYTAGVKSNHNEFLTRVQRFENVRDHLVVNRPELATARKAYLVIDDVVTTGASLIYAQKRLAEAGAPDVHLLGLGKNIGDLYTYA